MKTLIILHGWQSSKEKWNKVKEILKREGIRIFIPDLPGFRPENELKKPWTLDDYVEWFENFLEIYPELKEGFFLLGHSFGGRMAIKFAAKNPERLKGLILISAAGVQAKNSLKKTVLKYASPFFKKFSFLPGYYSLRKIFYKFIVGKTDYLQLQGYLKETFKKVIAEDLTHYLDRIKVRTLILWGSEDRITPLSDAKLLKRKIKDSKLEVLEKIGHAPYLENPKLLAEKIKEFLI